MKTDVNDIDVYVKGAVYNASEQEIKEMYIHKEMSPTDLIGDFHIKIVDNAKRMIVNISDFGGSKSSKFMQRNTTVRSTFDGELREISETYPSSDYRFFAGRPPPIRRSYDKFFEALDNAIKTRHTNDCYLALSDGHDSGTIGACIKKHNLSCRILSSLSSECETTVYKRINQIKHQTALPLFVPKLPNIREVRKVIRLGMKDMQVHQRQAKESLSHYYIAKHIPNSVLLSGLGADEFYVSGYDELLRGFMRDAHFAYDCFNIDARFPLLDFKVYCEYMRLEKKLRDGYKKPLEEYMKEVKFPMQTKKKNSFVVGQDLL